MIRAQFHHLNSTHRADLSSYVADVLNMKQKYEIIMRIIYILITAPFHSYILIRAPFHRYILIRAPFHRYILTRASFHRYILIRAPWNEPLPVVPEGSPLAWSWGWVVFSFFDPFSICFIFQGEFPVQDIQSGEGGLLQVPLDDAKWWLSTKKKFF